MRASGYQEKLVGENIAYGPTSADEVVRGWLTARGTAENIVDERFSEMGIAYVPGKGSKPGLYWVQVFAEPRTSGNSSQVGLAERYCVQRAVAFRG